MQETRIGNRIRQEIFSAETLGELNRLMDSRLDELTTADKEEILIRRRELSRGEVNGINRHERRKNAKLARSKR